MFVWGIALFAIGVPVLVYFFGKRWYCSWVCGCGGLAETLGDPYRQLSDKSVKAWKVERYLIHGVLVFAVVMTIGVLYTYFTGNGSFLGVSTYDLRAAYGFAIGSIFAGVVGTGFYPLMGNRVWWPIWVSAGGLPGYGATVQVPVPHHHQRRAVHFVRQLLHLL